MFSLPLSFVVTPISLSSQLPSCLFDDWLLNNYITDNCKEVSLSCDYVVTKGGTSKDWCTYVPTYQITHFLHHTEACSYLPKQNSHLDKKKFLSFH